MAKAPVPAARAALHAAGLGFTDLHATVRDSLSYDIAPGQSFALNERESMRAAPTRAADRSPR